MTQIHYQRLLPHMASYPLLGLYRRSVAAVGDDLYSSGQRMAWAQWADDTTKADQQLRHGLTLVAMANGDPVGFGQLYPGHQINMLYVDEGWQRQGIAKGLIRRLEAVAQRQGTAAITTRASNASSALFRRLGFEPVQQEQIHAAGGIPLTRTLMHKALTPGGTGSAPRASVNDNGAADGSVISRKGHSAPPVDQ